MFNKILIVLISVIIFYAMLFAQAPNEIRYNGRVKEMNTNVDGTKMMNFKLYNKETGGTAIWESGNQSVTVKNGIFSYTLSPDKSKVDWAKGPYYLEIEIENYKLSPREKLTSVPYSLCSENGIPKGGIIIWSGSANEIPEGWALCDGTNGTPDLRDRFVIGAGNDYSIGSTGGEKEHTLTIAEMPSHKHKTQFMDWKDGGGGSSVTDPVNPNTGNLYVSTDYVGGGQSHNNMPPYYSLCYIMRIK